MSGISDFAEMRRCQAPSQVAKRFGLDSEDGGSPVSPVTPVSGRKRRKVKYNEEDDDDEKEPDIVSPLRSPLANMINKQRAPIIGSCSPLSSSMLSPHEALIR